jgi:hypothetical protein
MFLSFFGGKRETTRTLGQIDALAKGKKKVRKTPLKWLLLSETTVGSGEGKKWSCLGA